MQFLCALGRELASKKGTHLARLDALFVYQQANKASAALAEVFASLRKRPFLNHA